MLHRTSKCTLRKTWTVGGGNDSPSDTLNLAKHRRTRRKDGSQIAPRSISRPLCTKLKSSEKLRYLFTLPSIVGADADIRLAHSNAAETGKVGNMLKVLRSFAIDESGATAIEYGLIAALIAVVIIGAVTAVGTSLSATFQTVAGKIA